MLDHIKKALTFVNAQGDAEADAMGRFHALLEASEQGILEWDLGHRQIYANERALAILGLQEEPGWIDEQRVLAAFPRSERERVADQQYRLSPRQKIRRVETHCLDARGGKVFVDLRGQVTFDEAGHLRKVVASIADVTEQRRLEERLRHEALHDFLTGLPNRTLLVDRIQHVLSRLKRNTDLNAALLFVDIENFKAVNDNLGHGFGDDVLVSVGERLARIVRGADTVARIGGDEFVILLEDPASSEDASAFADRLLAQLQAPLKVQNKPVSLAYNIGMVLMEDPESSVEAVLGDAAIAMYAAKESGRDKVVPFEAAMRIQAAKRLDIENALRQAIENDELYLVYQPIFSLQTEELVPVGVEALLRWHKSERGNIAPGELLSVAEENGLIEDIGLWAIDTAVGQLENWLALGFPQDFYININLSSRHFDGEEIVGYLLEQIDQHRLPRNGIRLEVVESAVIRNPERALGVIERLRNEGIFVSIDDFGTGFSSLSYLHRFPFHALKIDRSFVMDVLETKGTQDIIMAIILMARKLGIKVVAEGIETEAQLEFLRSVGCERGQGFLMAKPATPETLHHYFIEGPSRAVALD